MKTKLFVLAAALGLMLAAVPAWAHHAFAAEFDVTKPLLLKGTVTKMEWINPHAWIHLDVKNQDGTTTSWMIEAGAPNGLLRRGFNKAARRRGPISWWKAGRPRTVPIAPTGAISLTRMERSCLSDRRERALPRTSRTASKTNGNTGNTRETRNTLRIRRGDFAIQPIAHHSEDFVIVFLQQHQVAVAHNAVIAQAHHLG